LRCRGWAVDQKRDRIPDRFAIFCRGQFIAMSGPRGERYDVAKVMSSAKAVNSGFIFNIERNPDMDILIYEEVQVVALFEESHYAHIVGAARAI
jgi:hypothetical protein